MSSEVLAHFDKTIWSNQAAERAEASLKLVNYLTTAPESDVEYAVKRILRGLGSPFDGSRLGFGLALASLLRACESLDAFETLRALRSATDKSQRQDTDEKELLFAKLFGLHAFARAGVCFAPSTDLLAAVLSDTLELMHQKTWLRESASYIIFDLLQQLPQHGQDQHWQMCRQKLFVETSREWHAQKLAWSVWLQKHSQFGDWTPILKGHFQNTTVILHPTNLPFVAKLIKGETIDESSEQNSNTILSHQLPLILRVLVDTYSSSSLPRHSSSLEQVYSTIVDSTLLGTSASVSSKAMGLRLLEALLQSDVTIDTLASCLGSSNTIRTLINHSADKRAALHNLARQVLFATSEAGKRTPQAALPFLKALIEKPGSIQFDALTKTKTIESLVLSLEGVDIQTYIADLEARLSAAAVEVPSTDDEDPTHSEHNKSLRWTIDQLLLVSRKKLLHPATKDVDNSGAIFEVMQTLASAQLGTSELRQHAQSRVATILGDLVSSKSSVQEQGQVLVKATSIAKKRAAPSKALRSARKVVQATVNELDNSDEAQDAALRGLCQLIVFLTYSEDDSFAGLAEEVSDVVTSFKAAPMAVDAAEQEGGVAAEPTAVLVDYLLTLLRTTGSQPALQPVVRSVVESVFEVFIEVLGGQAIAIIKDQLIPSSDEDAESGDASGNEEESSSEDEADMDGDDEVDSDVGSDLGIDLDADPELRAKVEAALMGAGIGAPVDGEDQEGSEQDEDHEVDLDDDQMMALDDQLAAAFREHVSSKSAVKDMAQQDMQASQRALDLVDIYCKKQPSGRHVADLLQILFDVATSRQPSEEGAKAHGDLTAKASRVARSICSAKPKTLPPVVGFKKTLEGLQRIHEIARASAAEQGIASACALCLSRLILNTEATYASAVTELYRTSIKDFVYRKGSALNADFILPFLQRGLGWDLLTDVLEAIKSEKTVTAYRRIQAVGLLQALINAHKTESDKMALALPRMIEALFHVLQQNDIAQSLNAPRTKEVLKTILAISRIAQSVSTPDLEKLQNQAQSYLEALTAQNGNPGLKNMVQQILSTSKTRGEKRKKGDASVPIKPKVNGSSNGDGAALPKKKKQKVTSTAT